MPGNTPNVSRDSFSAAKFYDKCSIQQGVPVADSDWNEVIDNLRIAVIRDLSALFSGDNPGYGIDNGTTVGFQAGESTSPSNNFKSSAGWALVEGVLVPTTTDDPPQDLEYTDDENYLIAGTVTAIDGGSGIITDAQQYFQAFHDLLSTANHGPCYVKMTSGVESGNTFNITAYTSTTLTLSGGIGSIAVDDTFIVKPPALTTPGGSRTDSVYLMVWWEDLASEEDSAIEHPGLGVETCHRSQRRWCVRVRENSTSIPSTPALQAFTVRYLKKAQIARTASASITSGMFTAYNEAKSYYEHVSDTGDPHNVQASQVTSASFDHISSTTVQAALEEIVSDYASRIGQDIGINTDYGNGPLTSIAGGGLGDLSTAKLDTAMSKIDAVLVNRRGFTSVMTDGTASTGGDFDAADSVDDLDSFGDGGVHLLRRGSYTFGLTGLSKHVHVIGEGKEVTELILSSGATSNFNLRGRYENMYIRTAANNYAFRINERTYLKDIKYDSGTLLHFNGWLDWRGGEQESVPAQNQVASFKIDGLIGVGNPKGIIENVQFGDPPTGGSPQASVYITGWDAYTSEDVSGHGLVFRNCSFVVTAANVNALKIYAVNAPILFENCTFTVAAGTGYAAYLDIAKGIRFKNCRFNSPSGYVLKQTGACNGITYEDCYFYAGDDTSAGAHQFMTVESSADRMTAFRNCYFQIGDCLADQPTTQPAIEFGGINGARTTDDQHISIDGFTVSLDSSIAYDIPASFMVIWGHSSIGKVPSFKNITIFTNGNNPSSVDRTNGFASSGSAKAAWIEIIGGSTVASVIAENISVHQLNGSSVGSQDLGNVVNLEHCTVRGLSIEGSATVTTGKYSRTVALYTCSILHDLELYKNGTAIPSYIDVFFYGAYSRLIDAKVYAIFNIAGKIPISIDASFSTISGLYLYSSISSLTTAVLIAAGNDCCVIDNCVIRSLSSLDVVIIDSYSQNIRITNNTIKVNKSGSSANEIDSNAYSACLVDGNVVLSSSATAPTIANTGTGSVTGDNVLAANA